MALQAEDTAVAMMKIEELRDRVAETRAAVQAGRQKLRGQAQELQEDLRAALRGMLDDISRPNDRFL